jgi:stearoyl-CoA desaturase (delta-9 desaturase)
VDADLACIIAFGATYLLNSLYMSVFYHRALGHAAVKLGPRTQQWVLATGTWVTGRDPKSWACMHRLHHRHSDTPEDPHSPRFEGLLGVLYRQGYSYRRCVLGLLEDRTHFTRMVKDLEFPVGWLQRRHLGLLPHLVHASVGAALGYFTGEIAIGVAYVLGQTSHPIQEWMVNALAHSSGYRSYDTLDRSKNNTMVALLVMGEGYQNNHHCFPESPKFSRRWYEFDLGYGLCRVLARLGALELS